MTLNTFSVRLAALSLLATMAMAGCSDSAAGQVKTDTKNPAGITLTPEQKATSQAQIQSDPSMPPAAKARLLKSLDRMGSGSSPNGPP